MRGSSKRRQGTRRPGVPWLALRCPALPRVVRVAAVGFASLAMALASARVSAQDEPLLLNPFGDPFVAVTAGRDCPPPRGPAYTETQRRAEAHGRVERGNSCFLEGRCSRANAYAYDASIAEAAAAALRADPALADSAIWLIAERRFVYLQGCVADAAQAARAEALARAVPDVQLVIPTLALPGEAPRYPLRAPVR